MELLLPDRVRNCNIYLLDACAVMNCPDIATYPDLEIKSKIIEPAAFILTTVMLKEMDDIKYKGQNHDRHKRFYDNLRSYALGKKFSKVVDIRDGQSCIYFYNKQDITKVNDQRFDFLNDQYVDRHLLSFALALKSQTERVTIITSDALMQVLCSEFDLDYSYIENQPLQPQFERNNLDRTRSLETVLVSDASTTAIASLETK